MVWGIDLYCREWQHLYHDKRWVKGRLVHLARSPLCVYCLDLDRTTTADTVDHIVPHKGDNKLFFDTSNWQSLCKACHDGPKQLEESRGYQIGHGADGIPLGRHPWNEE